MNIKEKIVVLRNTEDGSFLKSFKNKKMYLLIMWNLQIAFNWHHFYQKKLTTYKRKN